MSVFSALLILLILYLYTGIGFSNGGLEGPDRETSKNENGAENDKGPSKIQKFVDDSGAVDEDYSSEKGSQNGGVMDSWTGTSEQDSFPDVEDKDKGKSAESLEEFPEGFNQIEGIVLDTTNVLVQEVKDNKTEYKPYVSKGDIQVHKSATYSRSREEAGWHFILFENPDGEPGGGSLILLQKLLGFTVAKDLERFYIREKEERLYQAFHIELGDDFDDENYIDDDEEEEPVEKSWSSIEMEKEEESKKKKTQFSEETLPEDPDTSRNFSYPLPINPYDNAELVSTDIENQDKIDEMKNETAQERKHPGENPKKKKKIDNKRPHISPGSKVYQSEETVLADDDSEGAQKILEKFEREVDSTADPFDETSTESEGLIELSSSEVEEMMSEIQVDP